jgi:hypothetical protein
MIHRVHGSWLSAAISDFSSIGALLASLTPLAYVVDALWAVAELMMAVVIQRALKLAHFVQPQSPPSQLLIASPRLVRGPSRQAVVSPTSACGIAAP